jgi:hypothetical protein
MVALLFTDRTHLRVFFYELRDDESESEYYHEVKSYTYYDTRGQTHRSVDLERGALE